MLTITVTAAFALRNPLKRWPGVFYALSVAAVVALFAGAGGIIGSWWKPLLLLLQRCMVPLALFTVVMFIGAFPKTAKAALWLRPVRAELSIVACILCLGHMCMYLAPYAMRALAGALSVNALVSFCVALALFALLLLLGVTSFSTVKKHMSAHAWKNVQRLAYVFFLLVYVHVMFMLVPAALQGGNQARLSLAIYTVVFVAYAALRLARAWCDRKDVGAQSVRLSA